MSDEGTPALLNSSLSTATRRWSLIDGAHGAFGVSFVGRVTITSNIHHNAPKDEVYIATITTASTRITYPSPQFAESDQVELNWIITPVLPTKRCWSYGR
jgi:hypothetical protein